MRVDQNPGIRVRQTGQLSAYRKRRMALVAASLVGLVASLLVPASTALASGGGDGCNPNRTNNFLTRYFAGADSMNTSGAPGGVYASIKSYSPFVAGTGQGAPVSDGSAEYVMLDGADGYLQIGWIEFSGSVRNTFYEYTQGSNFTNQYSTAFPINSTHRYTILYQPGNSQPFVVEVDGGPYAYLPKYFTPGDAQIFAEIHTAASQMPGGTADNHVLPTAGSSSSWQNFDGTTATYTGSGTNPAPSWVKMSPASGTTGVNTWRTWDTACTT